MYTLVSLTISESGNSIAGENYSLICVTYLNLMPKFKWTGPQGIINQSSTSTGITPDQYSTSVVTFSPLRLSHAGRYECSVSLNKTSKDIHVTSKFENTGIISYYEQHLRHAVKYLTLGSETSNTCTE